MWNTKRSSCIFIQENALENTVCEMSDTLSRAQCVKHDIKYITPNVECKIRLYICFQGITLHRKNILYTKIYDDHILQRPWIWYTLLWHIFYVGKYKNKNIFSQPCPTKNMGKNHVCIFYVISGNWGISMRLVSDNYFGQATMKKGCTALAWYQSN